MAPDVALAHCRRLQPGATVLDPMVGSGTVLRVAADAGLHGLGFDIDPLAVLMARVWTNPVSANDLLDASEALVAEAKQLDSSSIQLDWIDEDRETSQFIEYWFAERQRGDLRRLSAVLVQNPGPIGDALRVALSRLIITKDRGASLARDVSHSRPHRVRTENDFEVLPAFLLSAKRLASRLAALPSTGRVSVEFGDARRLVSVDDRSVDAVITSPPYLNAIDYMRGHRMSLVWFGYKVSELREIRGESIGTERAPTIDADREAIGILRPILGDIGELPSRMQGVVDRYLIDLLEVLREVQRVLKPEGFATFVIGNSSVRDVFIDNAAVVVKAAQCVGLELIRQQERVIPPSRRYLPPPGGVGGAGMAKRMRTEVVATFEVATG
jgi:SAM-dependent methyltransferase